LSDNVVAFGNTIHGDAHKEGFLRAVAQSYDLYVEDFDQAPDAVVYALCGITQPSQIGWLVTGPSEKGVTSVVSLAAVHMLSEAASTRQGLD
jgi:hypothetical protein